VGQNRLDDFRRGNYLIKRVSYKLNYTKECEKKHEFCEYLHKFIEIDSRALIK
jgi:hypothetical protein